MAKEEKQKALERTLNQIEKEFGKGSIMKLGEAEAMDVEAISTGALSLDAALGVGGIPKGRIVEVFGPESSGKTTVALHMIASMQEEEGVAAFIDAENALDPNYAKSIGIDVNDLLVSQPNTGEEALEICESLARSGAIDLIVIDSVAALVPQAEIEGEMGDAHVGLQARLMSQAMRKLSGVLSETKCTCVFINQIRMKVGVRFGNPETTPGGRALKFYSSVRLDIRRRQTIKDGEEYQGNKTKAKVVKNKVAPPFKTAEFDIMYGTGISQTGCILDMAEEYGIIERGGAWYSYGDDITLGQGRANAKEYLEDNPELMKEIEQKVKVELGFIDEAELEEEAETEAEAETTEKESA